MSTQSLNGKKNLSEKKRNKQHWKQVVKKLEVRVENNQIDIRQVKKNRKIEMTENLDIQKSKYKLEEPGNFDIIGNLLCNSGLTRENLNPAREIFFLHGHFVTSRRIFRSTYD